MATEMAQQKINYPAISIAMPTFNSGKILEACLQSIRTQNYPQDRIEILIVDGFSTDNTREIAAKYDCVILDNPKVIHPEGRVIGIKAAKNELILCLDSDNILDSADWMKKMTKPFEDASVAASEPLYYSAEKQDSIVTRYCSLIGGDDPIVIYLGFYERYSYLTKKWTEVPHEETDKGDYLKVNFLNPNNIPPLGANGFMVRKSILSQISYEPFYHIDVAHKIIKNGHNIFAKVKVGVVHRHSEKIGNFILKKKRRISRRLNTDVKMEYKYPIKPDKAAVVALKCLFVFPLIIDSIKGYCRKKDGAWFYHTFITLAVFYLYAYTTAKNFFFPIKNNSYEKLQQ